MSFWLFAFGAAVGSFLNVVSLRYNPEKFLLSREVIGGRSRCPKCGRELRWFELVPVLSFLLQGGSCRRCGAKISLQYPIVEILSGLIFVFVPQHIQNPYLLPTAPTDYYLLVALWVLIFLALLLLSLIDFRLSIIPDEANIFLAILGVFIVLVARSDFGVAAQGSFLGSYAALFGLRGDIWLNHIAAALIAAAIFSFIILITRGKGMGIGDLKLVVPLGLIFGWPDIVLIIGVGFVAGALVGVTLMLSKGKTLKSQVPFGPFLAAAAAIIYFFGYQLMNFYFKLFPL